MLPKEKSRWIVIIFLLIRAPVFPRVAKNCTPTRDRDARRSFTFTIKIKLRREHSAACGRSAIGQKHEYTLAFCNAVETILLLVYTRYGRSVLVIVRQVNASSDMRRAARISMYRGITHLRQIISSLNYIFPRRAPVARRGFISHLHRPSMRTKTEFLGHFPRRRCVARRAVTSLGRVSLYAERRIANFYTRRTKGERVYFDFCSTLGSPAEPIAKRVVQIAERKYHVNGVRDERADLVGSSAHSHRGRVRTMPSRIRNPSARLIGKGFLYPATDVYVHRERASARERSGTARTKRLSRLPAVRRKRSRGRRRARHGRLGISLLAAEGLTFFARSHATQYTGRR